MSDKSSVWVIESRLIGKDGWTICNGSGTADEKSSVEQATALMRFNPKYEYRAIEYVRKDKP